MRYALCPSIYTGEQMKRYPTYLTRTKGDRQPARMGVLAVRPLAVAPDSESACRELQLGGWEMEVWNARAGVPRASNVYVGRTADHFWAALWSASGSAERTVVLCPRLIQSLSLLGAWDRIDRGLACLNRFPMLLSDPPTALALTRPGCPESVLLLDSRNYGVEVGSSTADREALGVFARSMVAALGAAGLGTLQLTTGSQALYGYSKSYMETRPYTHMHADALRLERSALHGGRAECYRLGRVDGPIYCLDFAGFYASIMAELSVPVRLLHYGAKWDGQAERLALEGRGMLAHVRVRTEFPSYPGVRHGLTIYPVGEWWTTLAGPDLLAAANAGEVVEYGEWAAYDCEPALKCYALAMTRLRDGASSRENKLLKRWAKGLAVTLVGKWAQTERQWEDRPNVKMPGRWGHWPYRGKSGHWTRWRSVAGLAQVEVQGGETPTSCPAIAAWIYSEGRRRLWDAQLMAGRDEVIYSNTDSLFVTGTGYMRLLRYGMVGSGEPGRLRLQEVLPWIEILGISHYRTPGRTVCAGWIGSGSPTDGGRAPDWYAETAGAAFAERRAPGPFERKGPKERIAPYLHGVRGPDGRVEPWRM